MLASELVQRAFKLINIPGLGGTLQASDQVAGFESLQELLDSKSVSRQFVPGIVRHFFSISGASDILTYGPGGDLDTDDFDDPVPSRIESGFIRAGGNIVVNERVANDLFKVSSDWTLGSGWTIQNDRAQIVADTGVLSQTLTGLEIGTVYRVLIDVETVSGGSADFTLNVLDEPIAAAGCYEFFFTATATSELLELTPTSSYSATINQISVRERNRERQSFETQTGSSDYPITVVDQFTYNRKFAKGSGGRPEELIYTMSYPLGDLRFENQPQSGEYLFLDVTINRIGVKKLSDEIRMHPVATRWLRYALAAELAPEYGKTLKRDAVRNLRDARRSLAAANKRTNKQRMDRALRPRQRFDINRGDP